MTYYLWHYYVYKIKYTRILNERKAYDGSDRLFNPEKKVYLKINLWNSPIEYSESISACPIKNEMNQWKLLLKLYIILSTGCPKVYYH